MYKFITIRCRSCGSVIYNLPEKEIKKLKLVNLSCEDCTDHKALENGALSLECSKDDGRNRQIQFVS